MTELAVHEERATGAEVAVRGGGETALPEGVLHSPLVQWAHEAQQAYQIATMLTGTSFVPQSFRGKPAECAAAILAAQELGLPPIAGLRSMDVIQGTPALRAHAMRGLVQSRGHEVEVVSATPSKVVMRGRRAGSEGWQSVEWAIERAQQLGLTGKEQWKKQPQTMLIARATGEICRLIAADVLYAMPYASEEVAQDGRLPDGSLTSSGRVTAAEIMNNAKQPQGAERVAGLSVEPGGPAGVSVFERLQAEISWTRGEGDLEELRLQAAASRDAGEITGEQFAELEASAAQVAAQFSDGA